MNILNKQGLLTEQDRKEPLVRGCDYFTFKTNLDLSIPVEIIPYGNSKEFSLEIYSRDVASFISFWTNFVSGDLNGFSGFNGVKFIPVGFTIKN